MLRIAGWNQHIDNHSGKVREVEKRKRTWEARAPERSGNESGTSIPLRLRQEYAAYFRGADARYSFFGLFEI
jgi:hypothetical protein